jgi:iron complex outermembrane receptor protein
MESRLSHRSIVWLALQLALTSTALGSAALLASPPDLSHLSLEELMQAKIVSATKTEQSIQDTAAAVLVVTADDIRRSGATNIPEALRLVPGVEVARIDASHWAVTIRGFNGRFANKLLVLIDGRSIYSTQFSGVYWETENLFLPDIDRIEVIRGPGGTLWGANAVNGVINIITKHSQNTQDSLITLTAGNDRTIAGLRYGGMLNSNATYRLYGQFKQYGEQIKRTTGGDAGDDWRLNGGGFRVDWAPSARDSLVVDGDLRDGRLGQNFSFPIATPPYSEPALAYTQNSSRNLRARWERQQTANSQLSVQAAYQSMNLSDLLYIFDADSFDLDFQHHLSLSHQQDLVWGLGYHRHQDQFGETKGVKIVPNQSTFNLFSFFIEDQAKLIPEKLHLTAGVKLEHNDFTGFEWQPSLRLLWIPQPNHRLWASVSRAVRLPSPIEEHLQLKLFTLPPSPVTGNLPAIFTAFGRGDLQSEKLIAYEAGYRGLLTERFSIDAAVFYNDYDQLLTATQATPAVAFEGSAPYLLMPIETKSLGSGYNAGIELAMNWQPINHWRLRLGYAQTYSNIEQGVDTLYELGRHQQISLWSSWNIRDDLDLDAWWRYTNGAEITTFTSLRKISIDPYSSLNVRLGWRPRKDIEFSLLGMDLLDNNHLESVQELFSPVPIAIKRTVYGQVKWCF